MSAVDVGSEGLTEWREVSLREVLYSYDLVGARSNGPDNDAYIIVAERPIGEAHNGIRLAGVPDIDRGQATAELGYTSMSPWTSWTREELIPELRDRLGTRKYYDMKRNDGAIRGSLRQLKTPIQAARWFVEPASDSTIDKNIAEFITNCFFKWLNVTWSRVLDDVLLMFDYGYFCFEKVYTFNKKGQLILRKLAPRHPLDISEWVWDDRGGPAGIVMEPYMPYGSLYGFPTTVPSPDGITGSLGPFIPIKKLAIFSLEPEGGDLRGLSVLRSAYKHWYYKDTLYKIDAIQKERHGIGVPVIVLPPGFSTEDKKLADELGRNLRTNDRAHIVIPSNWQIMFAKLEGQPVSCIESIDHHNTQIRENILAPFMGDPDPGETSMDMFFKSTRYLADSVAEIFNRHIIPQLVDLNFSRGEYPILRARRIGEWNELRTWSFAYRNLVGAGTIRPDDPLEAFVREELDLPKMDPTTTRIVDTPQAPGDGGGDSNAPGAPKPPRVGPPRQGKPTAKLPAGNAGRDTSGGN
jgi:hypothetical protein